MITIKTDKKVTCGHCGNPADYEIIGYIGHYFQCQQCKLMFTAIEKATKKELYA